jgi:cytochrome c biogenesis protein CcmG/thiol:disulfide interchange protein DsbE
MSPFVKAGLAVGVLGIVLAAAWVKLEPSLKGETRMKATGTQILAKLEKDGAPQFSTPMLDGGEFNTSSLSGTVRIVHFWASWCGPCIEEFPHLVALADHFAGRMTVVAVATQDEVSDIERFLKQSPKTAEISRYSQPGKGIVIVLDGESKIADTFGTAQLPESYIIDKAGKVRRKIASSIDWMQPSSIEALQQMIDEPTAAGISATGSAAAVSGKAADENCAESGSGDGICKAP